MREIMDHAPVSRFMIHTNGLLLGTVGQEYLNRMEPFLFQWMAMRISLIIIAGKEHFAR